MNNVSRFFHSTFIWLIKISNHHKMEVSTDAERKRGTRTHSGSMTISLQLAKDFTNLASMFVCHTL